MSAALLPRVRTLVVCDEVIASEIETGVFTLEGVRYRLDAPSFPCRYELSAYLLLSSPRPGTFSGRVLVEHEDEKPIRYSKFVADFDETGQVLALSVLLGTCVFPAPEVYIVAVEFEVPEGADIRKAEVSFPVLELQE